MTSHLHIPGDMAETPVRKKPVQREWSEQKTDNAFLSKALPPSAYYTAIDHARRMSQQAGKMRKDRGVKAGIPDWLIVWEGVTLWIERKAGSDLSQTQKLTRDALTRNGHRWVLARSTDDVEAACRDAGIPLRATLGDIRTRIATQNEHLPAKKKTSRTRKGGPRFQAGAGFIARARKAGVAGW